MTSPPAASPATLPGAASNMHITFSSPFSNQANLSIASQTMSPVTNPNNFQQGPFMNTSASLNNIDLFNSSNKPPFGGAKTPFGDFGSINGNASTTASPGQFLNNNGLPPMKPHSNGGAVTDQFGLL